MKTRLGIFLLLAASMNGAPLVTIPAADLTVLAGQQATWGATVMNNEGTFVTFTSTFALLETNPVLGSYFDIMGAAGGPVDFVLPPGVTWMTSLASYLTDPAALPGAANTLTVRVLWEEYSDDPNFCGNCFVGNGFSDHTVSVTVGAVPEPGTAALFLLAGAGLVVVRMRRR